MDLVSIGYFKKTYSYRGQLEAVITNQSTRHSLEGWIFVLLNGDFIPFFIEKTTSKSNDSYIVSLKNISTEDYVKRFVGKEFFIKSNDDNLFEKNIRIKRYEWEGFTVSDGNGNRIGTVSAIIEHSENPLLQVFNSDNQEILIPQNADFLQKIDTETRQLIVKLPDGFLDSFTKK